MPVAIEYHVHPVNVYSQLSCGRPVVYNCTKTTYAKE
jgi:hypothetical protein